MYTLLQPDRPTGIKRKSGEYGNEESLNGDRRKRRGGGGAGLGVAPSVQDGGGISEEQREKILKMVEEEPEVRY